MLTSEEKIDMLERDIVSHSERIDELKDLLNVVKKQQKHAISQEVTLNNHPGTLLRE